MEISLHFQALEQLFEKALSIMAPTLAQWIGGRTDELTWFVGSICLLASIAGPFLIMWLLDKKEQKRTYRRSSQFVWIFDNSGNRALTLAVRRR